MEHKVYASFAGVEEVRAEWDALVERVGGDIFSTYDWCRTWWRHYGQRRLLQIHLLRERDQLVAVLPLFWEKQEFGVFAVRLVRLVGCDHSLTTCSPVIHPDRLSLTVSALIEYLDRHCRWDLLHLGPLPGYYGQVSGLVNALRGLRQIKSVELTMDHRGQMVFDLPSTFDAYLATLTKRERSNIRRERRDLSRSKSVSHGMLSDPEELGSALGVFISLHQTHWRQKGNLGHFHDWPRSEEFHREVAAHQMKLDRLVLTQLRVDDRVLASEYCYRLGDRAHWILDGRSREVGGRTPFCEMVKLLMYLGVRQLDASRGLYEYKRRLGARVLPVHSILATAHSGLAAFPARFFRLWSRALDMAYYRLWFSRLAPRVPYLQCPLWPMWIKSRV
ncbi:MAG TPA: GNAT family N-acetyltransferase [Phycisphaerae bacterium]|nr:GNAT family N-acetyltransferase [Phycisphaerae bacterium]